MINSDGFKTMSNKYNKPSKHSSWWRRLEDVFRLRLQKTSWSRRIYSPYTYVFRRRLQDVLTKTNIFVLVIRLQDVFKTSLGRLQDVSQKRLQDIFKTSPRHFQDVFKTSSRHLQDILLRRFQDVFKTSSRRLAKTSSRHVQDVFKTSCKDVFKTFSRRIIELNCYC